MRALVSKQPAMISARQERLILRELLRLEAASETAKLDNGTNIELMGPPFLLEDGNGVATFDRLPILEFIFSRLVVTFPLFKTAKPNFWPETVQHFIKQLATADISSSADRDEATKRRRMARGVRRMMMMMLMAGLNTNSPKQETGRYVPNRRGALESKAPPPPEQLKKSNENPSPASIVKLSEIQASVIGVDINPGTLFRGSQHLFIVEAILPGEQVVWTKRTYADFQNFDKILAKSFPGKGFAHFPHKDTSQSAVILKDETIVELPRENLRQLLRNYLHNLGAYPQVTQSKVYLEFVAKDTVTLSPQNIKDIEARIEFDRQRWNDYQLFTKLANERAQKLEKYLVELKSEILLEDALPKIFFEMKAHQRIEDMSPIVQKMVEYCIVEFASIVHSAFIARDDSPELFSQVKRIHSLMPYKVMQGFLLLSNPALIMKKMTDLFMATPFGSKSLLQKIFINILADDARSQGVLIEELREVIGDENLFLALHKFAWSSHCERELVTSLADQTKTDLVLSIIEDSDIPHAAKTKVRRWHKAWQYAVSSPDNTAPGTPVANPDDDAVERYSQLKDLYKLIVRQRDKDIMQRFWGEPSTMQIIKQLVDMIYRVLIEIFRTANVAESVGDFERFVTDLIKVVDRTNVSLRVDANQTVEELIGVCQKHQNSVFKFINRVYSKDGGFFVETVSWITRIVNFIRHGKEGGNIIDIQQLVKDCVDQGQINGDKLVEELDRLDEWLLLRKQTADESRSSNELEKMTKDKSQKTFDISDVGLTWDDVDYGYAEVERDEQEEILSQEQLGHDAVTREKLHRQKLEEIAARQNSLPPRPHSKELDKMIPHFSEGLIKTLAQIDTSPSQIDKGFS